MPEYTGTPQNGLWFLSSTLNADPHSVYSSVSGQRVCGEAKAPDFCGPQAREIRTRGSGESKGDCFWGLSKSENKMESAVSLSPTTSGVTLIVVKYWGQESPDRSDAQKAGALNGALRKRAHRKGTFQSHQVRKKSLGPEL